MNILTFNSMPWASSGRGTTHLVHNSCQIVARDCILQPAKTFLFLTTHNLGAGHCILRPHTVHASLGTKLPTHFGLVQGRAAAKTISCKRGVLGTHLIWRCKLWVKLNLWTSELPMNKYGFCCCPPQNGLGVSTKGRPVWLPWGNQHLYWYHGKNPKAFWAASKH